MRVPTWRNDDFIKHALEQERLHEGKEGREDERWVDNDDAAHDLRKHRLGFQRITMTRITMTRITMTRITIPRITVSFECTEKQHINRITTFMGDFGR